MRLQPRHWLEAQGNKKPELREYVAKHMASSGVILIMRSLEKQYNQEAPREELIKLTAQVLGNRNGASKAQLTGMLKAVGETVISLTSPLHPH